MFGFGCKLLVVVVFIVIDLLCLVIWVSYSGLLLVGVVIDFVNSVGGMFVFRFYGCWFVASVDWLWLMHSVGWVLFVYVLRSGFGVLEFGLYYGVVADWYDWLRIGGFVLIAFVLISLTLLCLVCGDLLLFGW